VANAQLAYQAYGRSSPPTGGQLSRRAVRASSARCGASTGVDNPDYCDTLYRSELAAPDTVNTMPGKTMETFADHSQVGSPVAETYAAVLQSVADAGIDRDDVFAVLETEGVQKFSDAWDHLATSVQEQLQENK
jgi:transaldolase